MSAIKKYLRHQKESSGEVNPYENPKRWLDEVPEKVRIEFKKAGIDLEKLKYIRAGRI
jgi:hypothetical protein